MTQLIGRNWYGIQVQDVNDQADLSNAARADAWNMAQHQNNWQNQRHGTDRSDAWAINRDRLNFDAWREGLADSRTAASVAAQERLAKMGFDFTRAQDETNWNRGANMRRIAEEQAGWAGQDRARMLADRQAGEELDNLLSTLAADQSMANASLDDFTRAAQARIAEANKTRGEGARPLRLPSQYLFDTISKRTARRDATADARRDRLAADLASDNPAKRAAAARIIDSDPTLKDTIDRPETLDDIPVNPADPKIMEPIRQTVATGGIRQAFSAFGRNREADPAQAAIDARQLSAAIDSEATRLAAQTGYSKSSIAKVIGLELQNLDTVGYPAFMRRPLSTLGSLVGATDKPKTEREAVFDIVFQELGLTRPQE